MRATTVPSVGAEAIVNTHWADGGSGTAETARRRLSSWSRAAAPSTAPLYPDAMSLFRKNRDGRQGDLPRRQTVTADRSRSATQLAQWEEAGYGDLPVCMAKTQYSFTTDPNWRGAPTGFDLPIREVRLSAGAGFVVAICGEIMTMPGLPKVPAAESIRLNEAGDIEGLF